MGIWNPRRHFFALDKHLLGAGTKIRKHLNGNSTSPTSGEMLCTIFLYSFFSSSALKV